jgi:aromatic ring-opening dioxygenase LigB subunit
MGKDIWVEFSEDADNEYRELQEIVIKEKERGIENSPNIQLLKSIDRAKNNLKIDPQFGIHIPRKYISRATMVRYGTDRLWKINLVGYWRLIYTIVGDEVKIVSFVLEFMNHEIYNKVFGYKKK